MKLSVVTRPGRMGDEKYSLKELKISFRHREIASMSAFCSCSPHWMISVPHIHLSHVFILASQSVSATKLDLLLFYGRNASGIDSSLGSAHITNAFIDVVSCQFMFPSIYDVPENGLQLLKRCLYTLLPGLLSFLSPQKFFCFPEFSNI